MNKLLINKFAVITGANRGIGKSISETFAKNGANIIACVRKNDSNVQKWKENTERKFGVKIEIIKLDLENENSIKYAIKDAIKGL